MMNLSSLLNSNEEGNANAPPKPSPSQPPQQRPPSHHQQQHPQQQQQHQQPPSTPVQPGPSPVFRDYNGPVHASPRGHSLSDYEQRLQQHQQQQQHTPGGGPYAGSPGGAPGPYGSRPVPPPLQSLNSGDLRSPGSASMSGPSPYRHTPSSSVSAGTSGGYPFPPAQGPSASSPVQHHQYPPGSSAYPPQPQQRDSYSHPGGMTGPPGASPYMQGQQPQQKQPQQQQMPPQTPPIGGPPSGAQSAAFPHQRSQSTHSTPTPGPPPHPSQQQGPPQQQQQQPPYGAPYGQVSPVAQHRQTPLHQQQPYQQPPFDPTRPSQSSQPPTPLGPPLSTGAQQRTTSSAGGPYPPQAQQMPKQQHKDQKDLQKQQMKEQKEQLKQQKQQQQQQHRSQPASPLQQRIPNSAIIPTTQRTPQPAHASPPPPTPSSIPARPPSASNASHHQRSQSRSDRAPSVSVSPKTHVPSLPSGSAASSMARPTSSASASASAPMDVDSNPGGIPSKRKMDERDLHPDEIDRKDVRRPAPFEGTNGTSHLQRPTSQHGQRPTTPSKSVSVARSTTPAAPTPATRAQSTPKPKKKRYTEIPAWARRYDGGDLKKPNFIIRKPGEGHHANGEKPGGPTASAHHSRHTSRQGSPEAVGQPPQAPAGPPTGGPPAVAAEPTPAEARAALLSPWEESVTGDKPYEELSRKVADFLFVNVVSNPNMIEIQGLGVQFEIEAKLGTLISKDTNQRIELPVATECILQDTGRVTFKSSMTEVQHKAYNDFLNGLVVQTDARNPINAGRARPRVPVVYKHRREIDRFFELPMGLQERLPACVRNLIPHRHTVKVRVTYDKKTNEVLAKIVKARIGDLNIFFPDAPLDCRLSVNLEMAWDGGVDELEALVATMTREQPPDREKDRLSYTQSHYQIDLTQVTYKVQGPQKMEREEKEHELEIELAPGILIEQGRRARNGDPHAYPELVEGLVDNVRILARRAKALAMGQ
ncbi:hypothetical protein SBRCBS47491_003465 [Sporothrix bragantina]|uniref:mRNA-capping enzyme subunit beta n=1 Tax=Sporothrix bragantina TaxID=671064 RepID=A0ABP0BFM1_9PEZI